MASLSLSQLRLIISKVAERLDQLEIDYAIMGGAAVCILGNHPGRMTKDVDFVIHVDHRRITADNLTNILLTTFPTEFTAVSQFGHLIPSFKLNLPGGEAQLVELEVFDYESWPQRPQYNIPTNSRISVSVNGKLVKVFSREWLFREKIHTQYQRQGNPKEASDIVDLGILLPYLTPGAPELDFENNENATAALANLLQKRPEMTSEIKEVVHCPELFGN